MKYQPDTKSWIIALVDHRKSQYSIEIYIAALKDKEMPPVTRDAVVNKEVSYSSLWFFR
jgi:hypothetical protein